MSGYYQMPTHYEGVAGYTNPSYRDEYDKWEREQVKRIEEQKENDPTNIVGWALKGILE